MPCRGHETPLLVTRYRLREGSGGKGRQPGGDGVERVIETRVPATLSILSERSTTAPYGTAGGRPGAPATIAVERAGGERERIAARSQVRLQPGDRVHLLTPGGGGFGPPEASADTKKPDG